jgi:NADH-quinone oxidoreductase subunit F
MNLEQIVQKARIQCSHLDDKECVRVTVSAISEEDVSTLVTGLRNWAEKSDGKVKIITSGSFGYYDLEPLVIIEKPGHPPILYAHVTEDVVTQLIRDYVEGDNPRSDLALSALWNEDVEGISAAAVLPVFKLQKRIALRNCGLVDPENINHYIAEYGGYTGLSRALGMSRIDVVEEMRRSRLRGRGGAGDLTAEKWKVIQEVQEDEKYVICNAVDSDVRAHTARLLLRGDPHSVLEGMLIAAFAVGGSQCIVAVATGNDGMLKKLMKALMQMRDYGLLGENILDSGFSCNIEIREVAPSLVSAEETALLRSLEGKQAMPYLRRNYCGAPSLEDKPTLINNVETFANVSVILQRGADWFSGIGTVASTGTKVISLSGAVVHPYTVEVPFGTTISTIIQEIGGGVPDGLAVKALQFGGPTGAYLTADDLDLVVDYDALGTAGFIMGSGTIVVIAVDTCAVEMADNAMSYVQTQSCGKCVFCREGTLQISEILKDIARGEGKAQDLDLLAELGDAMKGSSICALGRSAANPVLSSMKLFRHEYEAHINEKKCPGKR